MATSSQADIFLMERTAQVTVAADTTAVAGQLITVPTISTQYGNIRPILFEIADAAADLSVSIGTSTSAMGGELELTAAALLPNAGAPRFPLGPNDLIALESAATATTADIRWFWANGVRDGVLNGTSSSVLTSTKTAILLPVAVEAAVTIPTGAVQLVITSISASGAANGFQYSVDNGTDTGEYIPLLQGDAITVLNPYVIHINDGDRLKVKRVTADATVYGYWRILLS